jgi:hypothetical protein
LNVPIPIPTVSDRESLYRAVNIKDDAARSFCNVSYTIEDERRPPVSGKVRVDGLFLFVAREAPGSEGERSECFRLSRTNFKFGKGLGVVNALIAAKAGEMIAAPLATLRQDVERLVKEYKPPEHRVESLELTWKGGLWRMALEAALGVQYLHHHRYERACLSADPSEQPSPRLPAAGAWRGHVCDLAGCRGVRGVSPRSPSR